MIHEFLICALSQRQIDQFIDFLLSNGPDIGRVLLSVLGLLKVVARYTKWTWDDKVLSYIEMPIKWVVRLILRPPSA